MAYLVIHAVNLNYSVECILDVIIVSPRGISWLRWSWWRIFFPDSIECLCYRTAIITAYRL